MEREKCWIYVDDLQELIAISIRSAWDVVKTFEIDRFRAGEETSTKAFRDGSLIPIPGWVLSWLAGVFLLTRAEESQSPAEGIAYVREMLAICVPVCLSDRPPEESARALAFFEATLGDLQWEFLIKTKRTED